MTRFTSPGVRETVADIEAPLIDIESASKLLLLALGREDVGGATYLANQMALHIDALRDTFGIALGRLSGGAK
jgi:hypothetical protein